MEFMLYSCGNLILSPCMPWGVLGKPQVFYLDHIGLFSKRGQYISVFSKRGQYISLFSKRGQYISLFSKRGQDIGRFLTNIGCFKVLVSLTLFELHFVSKNYISGTDIYIWGDGRRWWTAMVNIFALIYLTASVMKCHICSYVYRRQKIVKKWKLRLRQDLLRDMLMVSQKSGGWHWKELVSSVHLTRRR